MKATIVVSIILAVFASLSIVVTAWPSITIYTDADTYQSGDTIEVSLSAENFGQGMSVAVYIGLIRPEGWIYTLSPWGQSGWSGNLEAWIPDIYVPSPFNMNRTPLWWFDVPSSMPPISQPGTYNFAALLTRVGSFDEWVCNASLAPFTIGGVDAPTAYIDSISPNPATQGYHVVEFYGHGEDDGSIRDYNWRSNIDGYLDDEDHFSMSADDLSVGVHTIYFKVKGNDNNWSAEASHQLTIETAGATGTVKGYVYETGTSTAISGVLVSIGSIFDITGSSGFYSLRIVPIGQRTINAMAYGYQPYDASISVSEGHNLHDVYLTAASTATTNLQGTVTDWDDQPIQDARVEVAGMFEYTDARGHYQFPNVPQGNQILTVTEVPECHEGYSSQICLYTAEKTYDVSLSLSNLPPLPRFTAEAKGLMLNILSWDELDCAIGYNIYVSYDNGAHSEKLNVEPVDSSEFEHTLFSNCDDMSYAVCAIALDGSEGELTDWQNVIPIRGGEITEDLTISGQIYLTSDLTISEGAVLTILSDSTVRLGKGPGYPTTEISVYGGLIAEGDAENPIIFERLVPDKAWKSISFWDSADDDQCRLIHCFITGSGGKYYSGYNRGGAIFCFRSSPTIEKNTITGNSAECGGGVWCYESSPTIENNIITDNSANYGGGIFCYNCSPTISNNIISGNSAAGGWRPAGGAIYCYKSSSPTITNNTITGNSANYGGGGIYCSDNSSPTIVDCIIWGNGDDLDGCSATYCCIEDMDDGEGNIHSDPMFVTGLWGEYYLDPDSPCVDAGSQSVSATGLSNRTTQTDGTPDSGTVDMGYHYPIP